MNQDGMTDAADIDFLYDQFDNFDWQFDLTGDGIVDQDDVDSLVGDVFRTLYGDANLDQVVDGSDFNIWNNNKFLAGTGWATGNFNGDAVTDASDFNIWNARKFQSGNPFHAPQLVTVPEPSGMPMMLAGILLAFFARKRTSIRN